MEECYELSFTGQLCGHPTPLNNTTNLPHTETLLQLGLVQRILYTIRSFLDR